jgi:hypothetical protein
MLKVKNKIRVQASGFSNAQACLNLPTNHANYLNCPMQYSERTALEYEVMVTNMPQ